MKTIVSTSLISFFDSKHTSGVFGFGFSHSMMCLLQTPADILKEAVLYLHVYFVDFRFCLCTTFYQQCLPRSVSQRSRWDF